jgi:ribonuclease P/MRP protein subunit RPP40
MLHGKKGFERLVWASKNVLNRRMTWLFVDLGAGGELKGQQESTTSHDIATHLCLGPIEQFKPEVKTVRPTYREIDGCPLPHVDAEEAIADPIYEEQLLEWIGLVLLGSPRIMKDDLVDPYLCRYEFPESADVRVKGDATSKLHHVQWRGLMPTRFITMMLLQIRKEAEKDWFAMNVSTFGSAAYTFMCRRGKEGLLWDVEGAP